MLRGEALKDVFGLILEFEGRVRNFLSAVLLFNLVGTIIFLLLKFFFLLLLFKSILKDLFVAVDIYFFTADWAVAGGLKPLVDTTFMI